MAIETLEVPGEGDLLCPCAPLYVLIQSAFIFSSASVIVLVPWALWCPQARQTCRTCDLLFFPLEIGNLGNWLTSLAAFQCLAHIFKYLE